MRQYLGIKVQNSFVDFTQANDLKKQVSLTEQLLKMTQEGHILKEQILTARVEHSAMCQSCEYEVKLKDCIIPLADRSDRKFRVSLAMNRSTFVEGDEGILYVSATKDAYLYIYSIDMEQNAALLFPNSYAKENLIRAEQQFIFPSEDLRQKGLKLKAQLPAGTSSAAEMIKVIATKAPLPSSVVEPTRDDGASGDQNQQGRRSFFRLIAKLHRANVPWVEDGQAFTIHEK